MTPRTRRQFVQEVTMGSAAALLASRMQPLTAQTASADVFGLKTVNPSLGPNARVSSMALVPVGTGHIDFKPVFAQASLAGPKHFVIEQDNAAAWGDSLAAARVSFQNLAAVLTLRNSQHAVVCGATVQALLRIRIPIYCGRPV